MISIEEIDALTNNDILLHGTGFNLQTQTFGVEWNILSNKIWIQSSYKDDPSNSY